jgi:hypothetical protein
MSRRLALALLCCPCALGAALLSQYSCQRPAGVDEGTWHNVSLAANLVDGTRVEPGAEFSFLATIVPGRPDYAMGNTFSSGRVVKSKGGGYCQVSTAVYNAALLAGLPIVERYPHSFYDESEAYVEPGRDAAVSGSSHADFKFLNPSTAPIVIRATAQSGRVFVQIFGPGKPQQRWISTEAQKLPMRRLALPGRAPRPGHDGWRVRRLIHVLDAHGITQTSALGVDEYERVDEVVAPEAPPVEDAHQPQALASPTVP